MEESQELLKAKKELMYLREIVGIGKEMRKNQKDFFKTKRKSSFNNSIYLEREFDKLMDEYYKPKLF